MKRVLEKGGNEKELLKVRIHRKLFINFEFINNNNTKKNCNGLFVFFCV